MSKKERKKEWTLVTKQHHFSPLVLSRAVTLPAGLRADGDGPARIGVERAQRTTGWDTTEQRGDPRCGAKIIVEAFYAKTTAADLHGLQTRCPVRTPGSREGAATCGKYLGSVPLRSLLGFEARAPADNPTQPPCTPEVADDSCRAAVQLKRVAPSACDPRRG